MTRPLAAMPTPVAGSIPCPFPSTLPAKRVRTPVEVAAVLRLCFGLFVAGSIASLPHWTERRTVQFTNADVLALVASELALGALAVGFLRLQGWPLASIFPIRPTWRGTALAAGLIVAAPLLFSVACLPFGLVIGPEPFEVVVFRSEVSAAAAGVLGLVNGLFEECLVVGYLGSRLRSRPALAFIAASAALRMSYHLYQGPVGPLSILPMGVVYAAIYRRTGNLWPLVLAHAALDILSLL